MSKKQPPFPHKGQIWVIDYNYKPKQGKVKALEIESQIKKFRPSLVLSNNIQNELDDEIIVAPLSSKELARIRAYEVFVPHNKENGLEADSKILLNRLRSVEKASRLREYCGMTDKETISRVKAGLKLVLDWEN